MPVRGPDERSGPTVATIVLPVYDPPLAILHETLASIDGQTTDRWQCVVVDDRGPSAEVAAALEQWCDGERRVLVRRQVNGGIAEATNDGIEAADGDVIVFVDHDDVLSADAIEVTLEQFDADERVDLVYSDEQKIDSSGEIIVPYGKPDWSPVRHLSHHYLNHLTAIRRSALGDHRARSAFEPTQDYDLVLRVIEDIVAADRGIAHVDRPLYGWRAIEGSSALDSAEKPEMVDAVRRTVSEAVNRRGLNADVEAVECDGTPSTVVRLRWRDRVDPADVTVISIDLAADPVAVDERVALASTPFVALSPASGMSTDAVTSLATDVARFDAVAVAGGVLVDTDGTIRSAGRIVEPLLLDPFQGGDDDGGTWGVLLATREVSAVAPVGLVAERQAWLDAGGLAGTPAPVGIAAAVAALCLRLAADGRSTIVCPGTRVTINDRWDLPNRATVATSTEWRLAGGSGATERFAPEGRFGLRYRPESVHERIARLVGQHDIRLVTSDVFDTIVTREVVTPSDLFGMLADRLSDHGIDPAWTHVRVRAARVLAERTARKIEQRRAIDRLGAKRADSIAPECTIEEIWSVLGPVLGVDPGVGCDAELRLESDSLRVIAETAELFEQLRSATIPIQLVSDTYLSSHQLRELLTDVGVPLDGVVDIITSSDRRLGKADGLLADVIEQTGLEPARILHLGDNPVADVATATELGCVVGHVELPADHVHVTRHTTALERWSAGHASDLGLTASLRRTLLAAGEGGRSASYQYGAVAAAPMLAGFSRWVDAQADSLGTDTLHFLLREGDMIADIMSIGTDSHREMRRVHASRWVDVRAAVFDGTADEIRAAIDRRTPIDAAHLARSFDLPTESARRILEGDEVPPAGFPALAERLAADAEVRERILETSLSLRQRAMRLLERELDLSQPVLVLVDVGWGGRIQEALTSLLRHAGHDQPIVGLYVALSDAGLERIARGHDLRSYLPNAFDDPVLGEVGREVAHHPEIVERLLTPPIPTFVDVDDDGDPVLASVVEPRPPSLNAATRGLRDSIADLRSSDDKRWVTDLEWRAAVGSLAAEAAVAPSRAFALDALQWSHDDLGGANTTRLDGDRRLVEMLRSATVRDVERLLDDAPVWIEGLAGAHNRTISALRRAATRGVAIEESAPLHPAGSVWISVFAPGSEAPVLQTQQLLGSPPDDWSIVRRHGTVPGVRAIRFDPGDTATLLELDRLSIITTSGDRSSAIEITSLRDDAIRVVGGRIIDRRRASMPAGAHLLVVGDLLPTEPTSVDISVRFRRWLLTDDDPLLRTNITDRVQTAATRTRRAIERFRTG